MFNYIPALALAAATGALSLAVACTTAHAQQSPTACSVAYSAFGGQTDSGERARAEDLDGATLYFLDVDNWPGQDKLSSLSLGGGGIVARSQFRDGKAMVSFPEGRHKVTIVAVQGARRYWAFHDRKALPFFDKPPLHEFTCAMGKVGTSRR